MNQILKEKTEALNQQEELKRLINQLFDEQGLKTAQPEVYKLKASIVSNVLANALARPKDAYTIEFYKNMENTLKKGKNPFAHISPEGKKSLLSIINGP